MPEIPDQEAASGALEKFYQELLERAAHAVEDGRPLVRTISELKKHYRDPKSRGANLNFGSLEAREEHLSGLQREALRDLRQKLLIAMVHDLIREIRAPIEKVLQLGDVDSYFAACFSQDILTKEQQDFSETFDVRKEEANKQRWFRRFIHMLVFLTLAKKHPPLIETLQEDGRFYWFPEMFFAKEEPKNKPPTLKTVLASAAPLVLQVIPENVVAMIDALAGVTEPCNMKLIDNWIGKKYYIPGSIARQMWKKDISEEEIAQRLDALYTPDVKKSLYYALWNVLKVTSHAARVLPEKGKSLQGSPLGLSNTIFGKCMVAIRSYAINRFILSYKETGTPRPSLLARELGLRGSVENQSLVIFDDRKRTAPVRFGNNPMAMNTTAVLPVVHLCLAKLYNNARKLVEEESGDEI